MSIPFVKLDINPKQFMQDSYIPFIHELAKGSSLALKRKDEKINNNIAIIIGYHIAEKQMYLTNMMGKMDSMEQESMLIELLFNMNNYTNTTVGKENTRLSSEQACVMLDKIMLGYKRLRDSFN